MALQPNSRMTQAEQDAFLQALIAKNAVFQGIIMMANDDSDDSDGDGDDTDTDSDEDSDEDDGEGDDDEESDDDQDDDEDHLTEDEAEAADAEVEAMLGEAGKKLLDKYRKFLKDNGIDEQTGRKKTKVEDIKGAQPKGDDQTRQARVALKNFAADNGFDSEYNSVLTTLASKVKFDEDGDLVRSSVRAIVADLKERKPAFFTESDTVETKTRVTKAAVKTDQRGARTVTKQNSSSSGLRGIEAKINSKVALSDTETAKLATLSSPKAEALWDRAEELGLLTSTD